MTRDPLAVLWRLRDLAVAEAGRELAAAQAREHAAGQHLDAQKLQIQNEQSGADDEVIAAFATWLPSAHQRAAELTATLLGEEERVLRLRQTLTARRTEAETLAKAMQRRKTELEMIRARREQAIMDEAAGRRAVRNGNQ